MRIMNDHGDVVLESDKIDLKITTDRKLFRRFIDGPDSRKKKYEYVDRKVPLGMTREQKEIWLIKLRNRAVQRMNENAGQNSDSSEDEETTLKEQRGEY